MAIVAAVLLLVPSAAHAQGTQEILRDCADDGVLAGRLLRLGDAHRPQQHADRARRVLATAATCSRARSPPRPPSRTATTHDGGSGGNGGGGGRQRRHRRRRRPAATRAPSTTGATPTPAPAASTPAATGLAGHAARTGRRSPRRQKGVTRTRSTSTGLARRGTPDAPTSAATAARHARRRAGPDRRGRVRARRRAPDPKPWPGAPRSTVGRTSRRRALRQRSSRRSTCPLPPAAPTIRSAASRSRSCRVRVRSRAAARSSSARTWTYVLLMLAGGAAVRARAAVVPRESRTPARLRGVWLLGAFALLTAFTALSINWSLTPSESWLETNRMLAYLATLAGALALGRLAPGPLGGADRRRRARRRCCCACGRC